MTVSPKKIVALLSSEGILGFQMAGIETVEVKGEDTLSDFLSNEDDYKEVGLLIVEEKLMEGVPGEVMRRVKRRGVPVIVPIHMPEQWQSAGVAENYIANLIKSAIGYRLKIKK